MYEHDVLVVGAGLSGLRVAIELGRRARCCSTLEGLSSEVTLSGCTGRNKRLFK